MVIRCFPEWTKEEGLSMDNNEQNESDLRRIIHGLTFFGVLIIVVNIISYITLILLNIDPFWFLFTISYGYGIVLISISNLWKKHIKERNSS